jgi:hypothetical protein
MDTNFFTSTKRHGSMCPHCGREILPRRLRGKKVGRERVFCSNRCRQAAFRNAEFARRYPPSGSLRNGQKNSIVSTACKGDFLDRPLPKVSREAWRKVVEVEQPWRSGGCEIVSSHSVRCFVVGMLRRRR